MEQKVHTVSEHLNEMRKEQYHPGNINDTLELIEFKLLMRSGMIDNCKLTKAQYLNYLEEMNFLSQEANNMRIAMYELGILEDKKICNVC